MQAAKQIRNAKICKQHKEEGDNTTYMVVYLKFDI